MAQSRCHRQLWNAAAVTVLFAAAREPGNVNQQKHLAHAWAVREGGL